MAWNIGTQDGGGEVHLGPIFVELGCLLHWEELQSKPIQYPRREFHHVILAFLLEHLSLRVSAHLQAFKKLNFGGL